MANPKIKVKRSSVEGKVPAVTQLERGELAVNSYDGKVYILKDQFSVGIATTTHTVNPWNEPNGVGAGISYSGDTFISGVTTANVLNFGDSNGSTTNIAKFGSGGDFTIQHNPSFFGGGQVFNALTSFNGNLQIENRDTSGPNRFLFLKSNAVQLRTYTGNESLLTATVNAGVSLFYDNSEKFVTTNNGGTLTGTLMSDGLVVSGISTFESSITAPDIITAGALLHEGDTDTLVHFSAANQIQLKTGGTSRLLVNNFGINLENGYLNSNGNRIILGDSSGASDDRLIFGNNNDLEIYHDSNNSIIDNNTGDLIIRGDADDVKILSEDDIVLRDNDDSTNFIHCINGGSVDLYHAGNKKFETSSSGATLTGTFVTDGLTVGNYDFPTVAGSEGLVLKVASDGNLEFGSGASGGVVPTEKTFTATQGQTVFTDTTDLPTYIQVFVNGIKIRPTSDFSKSGASITLVSAATAGDEIDLVRFD